MFCRLEDILDVLKGKWICYVNGQSINGNDKEEWNNYRNYVIVSIDAQNDCVAFELKPWESPLTKNCSDADWYKEHIKQFGTEPSSF